MNTTPPEQPSLGTILIVCTGNVCRSPYVELMLRRALGQRGLGAVALFSAGTQAVEAIPMSPEMAEILGNRGIDIRSFRSRLIDRTLVSSADLILTAEREHRAVVGRLDPSALSRVFTLRQAARLIRSSEGSDLSVRGHGRGPVSQLAERCAAARGISQPSVADDDVQDPWQRSTEVYRNTVAAMDPAITTIANALAAFVPQPGGQLTTATGDGMQRAEV